MCATCDSIRHQGWEEDTFRQQAFRRIEESIRAGQPAEHFTPLLDEMLGTSMSKRDCDLEREYEKGRRE